MVYQSVTNQTEVQWFIESKVLLQGNTDNLIIINITLHFYYCNIRIIVQFFLDIKIFLYFYLLNDIFNN